MNKLGIIKFARRSAAKLRRNLGISIRTSLPRDRTRRSIVEHEAAHAVAVMALGGAPLFVHIDNAFGGIRSPVHNDAMFYAVYNPKHAIIVGVAGMVWDESDWLGVADATIVYNWMRANVVAFPCQNLPAVRHEIDLACRKARSILRKHRHAVTALADHLESEPSILDGRTIRRITLSPRTGLPPMDAKARLPLRTWIKALNGDDESAWMLGDGVDKIVELARKQLKINQEKRDASNHSAR